MDNLDLPVRREETKCETALPAFEKRSNCETLSSSTMKHLILGLVINALISAVFGIMCHKCQTLEYKTCKDPYDTDNLDSCDADHFCTKLKTVVKIRDSGYIDGWERHSQVVTRDCEPRGGRKEGCVGRTNNGGITIKCWCGTDGCNSGFKLVPSTTILLVPFLSLLLCALRGH